MIEVAQAQDIILGGSRPLLPRTETASPALLGRILAEDVTAERDQPAFDKSLRDGYAVRAADCSGAEAVLRVAGEVAAGGSVHAAIGPGECLRIYTGAPLPQGADAVVMQEEVEPLEDGQRVRLCGPVQAGQWVYRRGQEMRSGEVVLPAGSRLNAAALGVLASLGRTTVRVHAAPRVGIAVTGNELLDPSEPWREGRIYNSNGPMLQALVASLGLPIHDAGILRDDEAILREALARLLDMCDVLVLAGGMSVGAYDFVPQVLHSLGLSILIRQVRMKPGKPFLYARRDGQAVFGLPGNPASAWVCYQLLVRPALRRMLGYPEEDCYPPLQHCPLRQRFATSNDRPTYYPARRDRGPYGERVGPLPWSGAPDLRALAAADALLVLPPGQVHYQPGELVPVLLLEDV